MTAKKDKRILLDQELDAALDKTDACLDQLITKSDKDSKKKIIKDKDHAKKTRMVVQQYLDDECIKGLVNEGKNGTH
jgi:RAB protein geranylgeranyltransferase component A